MHKSFIVTFLICFQLSAQDDVQKSIQAVDKALNFASLRRFDLAKRSLQDALKMDIEDSERVIILYDLASILLQEGNAKSAEKLFIQIDRDYTIPESIHKAFQINYAMASLLSIHEQLQSSLTSLTVQEDLSRFKNRLSQIEKESAVMNVESFATLRLRTLADMQKVEILQSIQNLDSHALIESINVVLEAAQKRLSSYGQYTKNLEYYLEAVGVELLEKLQIYSQKLFSLIQEKKYMFPVVEKWMRELQSSIQKKSISKLNQSINILQIILLSLNAQDPIQELLQVRIQQKNIELTDSIRMALDEKIQGMKNDQSISSIYSSELLKDFVKRISKDPVRDKRYYDELSIEKIPNASLLLLKEDQALSLFQSLWKKKKSTYSKDIQKEVDAEQQELEKSYDAWKNKESILSSFEIELSCISISYLLKDLDLQEKASLAASFEEKAIGFLQESKKVGKSDGKTEVRLLRRSKYMLESCKNLLDPTSRAQLLQEIEQKVQNVDILIKQSSIDAQIQVHTELKALFLKIEEQAKKETMQESSQEKDQSQKISLNNSIRVLQEMEKDDRALLQEVPASIQEGERPW